jgi:hypothetical protein
MPPKKSKIDRKLAQSLIVDIRALADMLEEGAPGVMLVDTLSKMVQDILDQTVNLTSLNMGYKATARLNLLKALLENRTS